MTRALIVYCHPQSDSFTAAVKARIDECLQARDVQTHVIDLYAERFDPVLTARSLEHYTDISQNRAGVEAHCAALAECDMLIFVYPTWWYGMPAILKGWLDRVMVPGLAFQMPLGDGQAITPGLQNVTRLAVFTTCGASWWLSRLIGMPGKRSILRGVRLLCAKRCKTAFAAHYRMDSSTAASRAAHLARIDRVLARLL